MSAMDARINRAAELREAFDRSFAQAQRSAAADVESLLAIRIGTDRYALRLAEVSGLFVDRKVTWLPSPVSALLGIVGIRGNVLPVYDLGMLLGCQGAAAPRWLAVSAIQPVGFAFEGFDGYLGAKPDALVPEVRTEARERHVREILQTEVSRPVVYLPSIVEALGIRSGHDSQT